jgi:membrane protein required for colicin V production
MTVVDYAVLVIIVLSVVLSVWRGMVREVLALVAWVVAFLLAQHYAAPVAALLPDAIPGPSLKMLAGFCIVFLSVLLMMTLVAIGLAQLLRSAGLGPLDRALGGVFGLLRGCLIVLVLVIAVGLTSLPRQPAWRNAMFSAPLEAAALQIRPWLPDALGKRISYD